MNWFDEMLAAALKRYPRGGLEPFVFWPNDGRPLALEEMKDHLLQTALRWRPKVERMFSEWASTGRWPRSDTHSGWFVREILFAAESGGAALSSKLALIDEPDESARKTKAWLRCLDGWYRTHLPAWVDEEAAREFQMQKERLWDY